jgi:transcriptional regulator with XRE-family HTH domain
MNPVLIGNYISEKRKSMGWTQRQLARQLSVTHQAVSRWEQGLALPDIETIVAMARLFGITVDRLLNPELKASASVSAPAFEDIENEPEEPIDSEEADESMEGEEPEEPDAYNEPAAPSEPETPDSTGNMGEMGDMGDMRNPYTHKHHNMHRKFKMYKNFKYPHFPSSGFKMPEIKIPNIHIPEIKVPEINIPEIHINNAHKNEFNTDIWEEKAAVWDEREKHEAEKYSEGPEPEKGEGDKRRYSSKEIDDILCKLEDLAPFVSREVLSGKFINIISQAEYINPETLCDLAPFLNKDAMSAALDKIDMSRMDTGFIEDIAPFIRGPKLAELIMKIKDKQWLIDNFEDLIPFLPREFADRIFMELF